MSVLRVATIVDQGARSAPSFPKGLAIGESATVTGNINITGVATCTALVGDGSNITGSGGVLPAQAISLMVIV
jgi:hypothetical protein